MKNICTKRVWERFDVQLGLFFETTVTETVSPVVSIEVSVTEEGAMDPPIDAELYDS